MKISKFEHKPTLFPYSYPTPVFIPCRKVKNSWGETWGLDGFILLERADSVEDVGGECGLLIEAVYPVLGAPTASDASKEKVGFDLLEATVLRAVDFKSSATAKDCGSGTSEIVFDDGECVPDVSCCWRGMRVQKSEFHRFLRGE